jgi:V/A-type H+-transporting ATPase subunit A
MKTRGIIKGIIANLLMVEAENAVGQNEICTIAVEGADLMGEVIKIKGKTAFIQVFDSTRGLHVGTEVTFTGGMLEVTLGPGMLYKN